MKKKLLATLLMTTLALSLVACGNDTATTPETELAETVAVVETEEVETEVVAEVEATEVIEATEMVEETETVVEATESVEETEVVEEVANTPAFTYTEMNATKYAKSSVNVRDLPNSDGNRVAGLTTNQQVKVTGQCNETGWYRIELNGDVAYVSNSYLVDNKVTVATTPAQSTNTTTQSTTTTPTQNTTAQNTQSTPVQPPSQETQVQTPAQPEQSQPKVEPTPAPTPAPEQPVTDANTGNNSDESYGMGIANDNSGTVVTDPEMVQILIDTGAVDFGTATLNPDGSLTLH